MPVDLSDEVARERVRLQESKRQRAAKKLAVSPPGIMPEEDDDEEIPSPLPFSGHFLAGLPQPGGWEEPSEPTPRPERRELEPEVLALFTEARRDWAHDARREEMEEAIDRMQELLTDGDTTLQRCKQLFTRLKREKQSTGDLMLGGLERLAWWRFVYWHSPMVRQWRDWALAAKRDKEIHAQREHAAALELQRMARGQLGRLVAIELRTKLEGQQRALGALGGVAVASRARRVLWCLTDHAKDAKALALIQQAAEQAREAAQQAAREAAQQASTRIQALSRGRRARKHVSQLKFSSWKATQSCNKLDLLGGLSLMLRCSWAVRTIRAASAAHKAASTLQAVLRSVLRASHWRQLQALQVKARAATHSACQALDTAVASAQGRQAAKRALDGMRRGLQCRKHERMQLVGVLDHFSTARGVLAAAHALAAWRGLLAAYQSAQRKQSRLEQAQQYVSSEPGRSSPTKNVVCTHNTLIKGPGSRRPGKPKPFSGASPANSLGTLNNNDEAFLVSRGLIKPALDSVMKPPKITLGQLKTNKKAQCAPGPLTKRVMETKLLEEQKAEKKAENRSGRISRNKRLIL